jgi:hypothetical protein
VLGLDDAEAAALERPLADQAARDLGQILDPSPAHVAAARALTGIEVAQLADGVPPGAARQTFDPNLLHVVRIRPRRTPSRSLVRVTARIRPAPE